MDNMITYLVYAVAVYLFLKNLWIRWVHLLIRPTKKSTRVIIYEYDKNGKRNGYKALSKDENGKFVEIQGKPKLNPDGGLIGWVP